MWRLFVCTYRFSAVARAIAGGQDSLEIHSLVDA
jgi:hypothetical protein